MLICYYYVYRVVFKYPYYFRLVSLVTGSIGQPGFNQPIKTSVLWLSKYDIICNQKKIRIFSKYKTNMDAYNYLILCLVKWNRMFLKHLKQTNKILKISNTKIMVSLFLSLEIIFNFNNLLKRSNQFKSKHRNQMCI